MNYSEEKCDIISLIKQGCFIIAIISTILEMLFYTSVENAAGCLMMWITMIVYFAFVFDRHNFVYTPFSSIMMLSIFLFHYLPVPATLLSLRPVSYGMAYPIKTFALETVMVVISCIAFNIAKYGLNQATLLKKLLNTFYVYEPLSLGGIWVMGLFGLTIKIYAMIIGTGGIIGKIMDPMVVYAYAPVLAFFPCIYRMDPKQEIDLKNIKVWGYILIVLIVDLASNSRNAIITPFCIIILLLLLSLIYCNTSVRVILSIKTVAIFIIVSTISLNVIGTISNAMILVRSERDSLSFSQMINATVNIIKSENFEELWEVYEKSKKTGDSYRGGWNEDYTGNTFLDRFCNIRITDEVFYFGEMLSNYDKEELLEDMGQRTLSILPGPLLNMISPNTNKSDYENSRSDVICAKATGNSYYIGSYLVNSHLADGYLTFGIFYFPLQLLLWVVVMRILNCFVCNGFSKILYSPCALIGIFTILKRFQNGNGMMMDIGYIFRGYWQEVFIYIIVMWISCVIAKFSINGRRLFPA